MKRSKSILYSLLAGVAMTLFTTSCEENPELVVQEDILPTAFRVDIPSAITNASQSGRISGRTKADTLKGNAIYLNLATFIAVGDGAGEIVEDIIIGLKKHQINRVISLSYISDDDNRVKNLNVTSDVELDGKLWEYMLIVTDAESENNSDGGKAMQIFWNHRKPFEGIAILKPYNIDRKENPKAIDAIFRIDYTEVSDKGYDAEMEVQISGLPLENPLVNQFSISSLHMFAGKKGDIVDVYGNSNHPNARLFSTTTGFNWAFVGSGSDPKNVGVAEVGLPPSDLDESDRTILLKDYSIKNVFTDQINEFFPGIDQDLVDAYLSNTAAPGYFGNNQGFISGGVSPGPVWDAYAARLDNLSPFNPLATSNLKVDFISQ